MQSPGQRLPKIFRSEGWKWRRARSLISNTGKNQSVFGIRKTFSSRNSISFRIGNKPEPFQDLRLL